MPSEGVKLIAHDDIIRFEEIEKIVRAAVSTGVTKIRLTGGEPLVRKGLPKLISQISKIPQVTDIPVTTNGILLKNQAKDLKKAGLDRITVSMDTLKPEKYEQITKRPWFDKVIAGIEEAQAVDLAPVKINVVVVPGENDDEIIDFVDFAVSRKLEIRFIERMPISSFEFRPRCGRSSEQYIPSQKLIEIIEEKYGKLEPVKGMKKSQPAKIFYLPGQKGRIGFITAMSQPFCKYCSRMRLTPDGKLRMCLAHDIELDMRGPIRDGASDDEILALFNKALSMKPEQEAACFVPTSRLMSQIGG
jgi:GTP 3',8-cyclase